MCGVVRIAAKARGQGGAQRTAQEEDELAKSRSDVLVRLA